MEWPAVLLDRTFYFSETVEEKRERKQEALIIKQKFIEQLSLDRGTTVEITDIHMGDYPEEEVTSTSETTETGETTADAAIRTEIEDATSFGGAATGAVVGVGLGISALASYGLPGILAGVFLGSFDRWLCRTWYWISRRQAPTRSSGCSCRMKIQLALLDIQ